MRSGLKLVQLVQWLALCVRRLALPFVVRAVTVPAVQLWLWRNEGAVEEDERAVASGGRDEVTRADG